MAKVGAPKGGRVHWLLINLPLYVKKNYYVNYNYPYHDYCIHRKCKKISTYNFAYMDLYVVKRTSRKCWRLMAFNMETAQTIYRTFSKSAEVAAYIGELANAWHEGRAWTQDREYIENEIKNFKEKQEHENKKIKP